jgi:hypothetical protein
MLAMSATLAKLDDYTGLVRALRHIKIPAGYLLFAGEGHGFKKAESIERALDAELYFYSVHVFRTRLVFWHCMLLAPPQGQPRDPTLLTWHPFQDALNIHGHTHWPRRPFS